MPQELIKIPATFLLPKIQPAVDLEQKQGGKS
jgi:hypothetical protein